LCHGLAIYSATKPAICSFSNNLRHELAGSGVFVTSILFVGVRTAMTKDALLAELDNLPKSAQSPFLQMLSSQIDTPEKAGNAIVDAARYRRREVTLGGPSVAAVVLIESLAAAQVNAALKQLDTQMLIDIGNKFHN
jgi:short-subunit dehydrogenase